MQAVRALATAACAFAALCCTAGAQTADVRSGEHEGFSRLVIRIGTAADWRFGRTEQGYELDLGRPDPRFDLSAAFERIPRTRLGAAWADPATGRLQLRVVCACHAVAFALDERTAVIDIRDGAAPDGSGFERSIDRPDAAALPPLRAVAVQRPRPRPGDPSVAAAGPAATGGTTGVLETGPRPDPTVPDLAAPADAARVEAARDEILRDLAAAAARGTVDPAVRLPSPASDADAAGGSQPAQMPENPAAPAAVGGQVEIRPDGIRSADGLTADGRVCLPDSAFALGDWRAGQDAATAMASGRTALAAEFDRPSAEAIRRHVRELIAFGFGAEARSVARVFGISADDTGLLDTLAYLVDGTPPPEGHPLAGMEVCNSAAALWAVLARDRLTPGDPVDASAVALAFGALPADLRLHLGPALADRFLDAGDAATVRTLRDAIARGTSGPATAVTLIDARTAIGTGEAGRATEALEALVAEGGPHAVDAMLALVDALVAEEVAPDPALRLALAALEREYEGTPRGAALRDAQVLAAAAAGDYDAAFGLLPPADASQAGVRATVFAMLAGRGGDDALLRNALAPDPSAAPSVRLQIAERFTTLGFPEIALRWTAGMSGAPAQRLRAAAHLARGDGRAALRELAAEADPEAESLRARALEALDQADPAAAAWQRTGDPGAAAAVAWRARSWAAAERDGALPVSLDRMLRALADPADGGAEPAANAASAPAGDAPPDPLIVPAAQADAGAAGSAGPVSLAAARTLLAEAAGIREDAAGLLRRFPPP